MTDRTSLTIRLESFEGPLDLLLYLIQSNELDISTLSIAKITDQYLNHIRLMQEINFDVASEFLVMAATLLYWKSKALLPKDNENQTGGSESPEDDFLSQEELLHQLLEHQRFRAAGDELTQLPQQGMDFFLRSNAKPPVQTVWREMNISDLALSFQDSLIQSRKRVQILKKEAVSLSEKITEFDHTLEIGKITELRLMMSEYPSVPEMVVTFLASLELSRLKKLRLYQNGCYQPIYIELLEKLNQIEMKLNFEQTATG